MAKKLPGLRRVLGASPLASVAYGEIGSSLYFALGIVALYALGFTPWVLLAVGAVFMLVALSYAEGTAAIPEPGGAATFVRRAYNDLLGFLTGWALFLDYLIVIALAALFVPHYFGNAVGWDAIQDEPWDVVLGIAVVAAISIALLIGTVAIGRPVRSLAALYSFGVLLTFLAAQVAVVRLRATEPDLPRPFRVPVNVRIRGVSVPMAALLGIPLTFLIWVAAVATHSAAPTAGPALVPMRVGFFCWPRG